MLSLSLSFFQINRFVIENYLHYFINMSDNEENEMSPRPTKTEEEEEDAGEEKIASKDDHDEEDEDEEDEDENEDREEATGPTLQVEIQQNSEETPEIDEEDAATPNEGGNNNKRRYRQEEDPEEEELLNSQISEDYPLSDPKFMAQMECIKNTTPNTELEVALTDVLQRKELHIARLVNEINKLKKFISKRKQTYKRKRKDGGAPTRALSAYNIFIQDQFAKLAKENDAALKSADTNKQMQRVPPSNLVAKTGNAWKLLPAEEKAKYEERAKTDRKRYEEQMQNYQPPDKQSNRKRNKTGYNMFFSAHVLRLKQSEMGVPSERGSVARLVGNAWKVSKSGGRTRKKTPLLSFLGELVLF
jgi:hypothetical protein